MHKNKFFYSACSTTSAQREHKGLSSVTTSSIFQQRSHFSPAANVTSTDRFSEHGTKLQPQTMKPAILPNSSLPSPVLNLVAPIPLRTLADLTQQISQHALISIADVISDRIFELSPIFF